jgi:hypothetical protein
LVFGRQEAPRKGWAPRDLLHSQLSASKRKMRSRNANGRTKGSE